MGALKREMMKPIDLPKHYNDKFYNWDSVYYYNHHPCVKVEEVVQGNVIDHCGDRASSVDILDSGYIVGKSLCGDIKLKIEYDK